MPAAATGKTTILHRFTAVQTGNTIPLLIKAGHISLSMVCLATDIITPALMYMMQQIQMTDTRAVTVSLLIFMIITEAAVAAIPYQRTNHLIVMRTVRAQAMAA